MKLLRLWILALAMPLLLITGLLYGVATDAGVTNVVLFFTVLSGIGSVVAVLMLGERPLFHDAPSGIFGVKNLLYIGLVTMLAYHGFFFAAAVALLGSVVATGAYAKNRALGRKVQDLMNRKEYEVSPVRRGVNAGEGGQDVTQGQAREPVFMSAKAAEA